MKRLSRSRLGASVVLIALLSVVSPQTVFAHAGHSEHDTPTVNLSHSTTDVQHDVSESSQDPDVLSKSDRSDGSLRDRAQKALQDKRQGHKTRTVAQRQEACRKQAGVIDRRFAVLGTQAGRHLKRFNATLSKLQAYQSKKQLDVVGYDALVADAKAKQAAATEAVNVLVAQVGVQLDCTTTDPATNVAVVRTAVRDAHEALQSYRQSLKALVKALQAVHATAASGEDN